MKKLLSVLGIILVCSKWFIWPAQATAQTIIFADDFETGLTNWESVFGSWNLWSASNGTAFASLPTSYTRTEITPDITWNPDWQHYRISFDYYVHKGVDKNINFGFTTGSEWYEVQFTKSQYYIRHVINSSGIWREVGSKSLLPGQLYRFEIELNAGRIQIWIDGTQLLDTVDPTYSGSFGKPTLKATTGSIFPTTVSFDNFKITLLEPTGETFEVFKQSDPRWALLEYDSASTWDSVPTMERWGCAVTSLAMILRHHGITQLPGGTELDPSSLNTWLKDQPDGYVGNGLVNWIAAMRLTAQMSPVLQTPKLEYQRHTVNPLQTAQAQLTSQLPVVLQIPGHFLVGHAADQQDITIADPAYEYTTLSQHQTELLSTRTFTPSNTDLSYLLFVHDTELSVQIESADNHTIQAEHLSADTAPAATTTTSMIQEIAKPESGTYTLTISQAAVGNFELELYLYDAAATVLPLTISGTAGPTPITYQLTFNKEEVLSSSLTPAVTFAQLQEYFELAFTTAKIAYPGYVHVGRYLEFAVTAEQQQAPAYQRYTGLLTHALNLYQDQFEPQIHTFLQAYLTLLEEQFADNPV